MAALVAGPWGDLSEDLHRLLRVFAEARVANRARAEGWGGAEASDLGQAMGEVRRATSVTVVRLQALCLLERLGDVDKVVTSPSLAAGRDFEIFSFDAERGARSELFSNFL